VVDNKLDLKANVSSLSAYLSVGAASATYLTQTAAAADLRPL
jgi:hypothetical protein